MELQWIISRIKVLIFINWNLSQQFIYCVKVNFWKSASMGIFKMNHFPISFPSDQKPCLDFDQSCFLMDGWLWPKFRDKCWDPVRQFLKSLRVIKVIKHFFPQKKVIIFHFRSKTVTLGLAFKQNNKVWQLNLFYCYTGCLWRFNKSIHYNG